MQSRCIRARPGQRKAIEKMSWLSNPPPGMRPEVVMEEILRLVYYREWLEANRDRIIASTTKYTTPTITYARQYEALVTFDTTGRLNKIKSSTLVVHGEDDEAIFSEAAMFMAKHIPGAEYDASVERLRTLRIGTVYPGHEKPFQLEQLT